MRDEFGHVQDGVDIFNDETRILYMWVQSINTIVDCMSAAINTICVQLFLCSSDHFKIKTFIYLLKKSRENLLKIIKKIWSFNFLKKVYLYNLTNFILENLAILTKK